MLDKVKLYSLCTKQSGRIAGLEKNILLTISFDGSKYHGWQIQDNAMTVQECFQNALYKILKQRVDIKACSRTDSGVHAREFCISLKIDNPITPQGLVGALNHFLPNSIVVLSAKEVSMDFHARYSCKGKEYKYEIWNNKIRDPFLDGRAFHFWYDIDVEQLDRAAKHFIGKHDFTSFCTKDSRVLGDMRRTVLDAGVSKEGDKVIFTVSADGFLYNMVRIMVGTLLKVQEGKIKEDSIPSIIKAKNRSHAGVTAPAQGLYLNKVFYEF